MRAQSNVSSSPHRRKPRIGLTQYSEVLLKEKLRKRSPSEPWVEEQIKTTDDVDADGKPILYRYFDPHAFPPGGEKTKMIRCPRCGIFNPPNAMEHGLCLDHARHQGWTPSPSALAFVRLQLLNAEIEACELAPEDTASLRREIRQFEKTEAANSLPRDSRFHRKNRYQSIRSVNIATYIRKWITVGYLIEG
jgi:hypothetical protein